MILNSVRIVNFLSVKDENIDFKTKCRILVGINESGKSNILKAIRTLSDDYQPNAEDMRQILQDESVIKESKIDFNFSFTSEENESIFEAISSQFLVNDIDTPIVTFNKKQLNLKDFCISNNDALYRVDIYNSKKTSLYYSLVDKEKYSVIDRYKKIKENTHANYTDSKTGKTYSLDDYSVVNIKDFQDFPKEYIEELNISEINSILGNEQAEVLPDLLPEVIFWDYNENLLLPSSIDVNTFIADPNSCIPLKNIFLLADIEDIGQQISKYKSINRNAYRQFINNVCEKSTKFFREVWKEYKNIEIKIEIDGEQLLPVIREKIDLDFHKRSDGFKRFISFLLHISVKVKKDIIKDAILIVDEPEISLHPSGAKYLRNELIKISNSNYVIFSTHSIFMIDGEKVERHIIVKKDNDITKTTVASESNLIDEEVLFRALNYSLFEPLKDKNILFEGWRDKKLFQVAKKSFSTKLQNKFKKIGICHGNGVPNIKNITPVLELANKNVMILSDADTAAIQSQDSYIKGNYYGIWKRYDEIDPLVEAKTGEDFLKNSYIQKTVNNLKNKYPALINAPDINLTTNQDKLAEIRTWLANSSVTQEDTKKIIDDIKTDLFNNLKTIYIEKIKYLNFIEKVSNTF